MTADEFDTDEDEDIEEVFAVSDFVAIIWDN